MCFLLQPHSSYSQLSLAVFLKDWPFLSTEVSYFYNILKVWKMIQLDAILFAQKS